jgi:NAD(P)-dependent dehydrogenase (short-subunit alcohol dehydrogenase family)
MSKSTLAKATAKHAVIVGGSTGIGFAIADAFASEGYAISIVAHDDEVFAAAKALRKRGSTVKFSEVADITIRDQVQNVFDRMDTIDVLVCNAGIEPITPLGASEQAMALFRRVVDVNLVGQHYCTVAALDHMRSGSALIFTSSIWGKIGVTNYSAYCASKHGIIGYMRALSRELASRGISVNAVCPGQVLTSSVLDAFDEEADLVGRPPEVLISEARMQQAFDKDLSAGDVAKAYVFLARNSGVITGQALTVDMGGIQI